MKPIPLLLILLCSCMGCRNGETLNSMRHINDMRSDLLVKYVKYIATNPDSAAYYIGKFDAYGEMFDYIENK